MKGYKPGWTAHKYKERFGEFPPWAWSNHVAQFSGLDPSVETMRWIQSRIIAYARGKAKARDYRPNTEATQLWLEDIA